MRCKASLRRVARNLQCGGGVFWRLETTSNDLDLEFDRSSIDLSWFLSPNIGDLQQTKKRYPPNLGCFFCPNLRDLKKKSSARLKPNFFCSKSHLILDQLSLPIPLGGGRFSFLVQKSASKVPKTGCFAYSSGQWGATAPPPRLPTGYTTGVTTKGKVTKEKCLL